MARTLGGRGDRNREKDVAENLGASSHQKTNQAKPMTENDVMRMYHAMEGKSQQEIQEELFRVAEQEIRAGTFDTAQLDDFYRAASPMLTGSQQKQMAELIRKIQGRF